jgi:hypothetical protein
MTAQGGISGRETVVLTAAASFASGVFIIPRLLVADSGRAGILALLLASAVALAWAAVVASRAQRIEGRDLPLAVVRQGGIFGRLWLFALALFEVMIAGSVVSQYTAMATTVILPGGSRLGVAVLFSLAALSAARHRVQGLARTIYVSFLFAAVLALSAFALLLARSEQLAAVLPGPHLQAVPIMVGTLNALVLYEGTAAIVAFMPAHRPGPRTPAVEVGVLVGGLLAVIAYVAAVGTGGPEYVLGQIWPVVSALRTLVLASFVLNRIGLIVVLTWSAFVLTFAAIHLWAATEYAAMAFGIQRWRTLVALGGTLLVISFGLVITSQAQSESVVRGVITPAVVAVLAIWLALSFLLTRRSARAAA